MCCIICLGNFKSINRHVRSVIYPINAAIPNALLFVLIISTSSGIRGSDHLELQPGIIFETVDLREEALGPVNSALVCAVVGIGLIVVRAIVCVLYPNQVSK